MKVYRVEVVLYEINEVGTDNEQAELLEEEETHADFATYEEALVELRSHIQKEN